MTEPTFGRTQLCLLTEIVRDKTIRGHDFAIFATDGYGGDRPGWDDLVTAGFLVCEEQGLIEAVRDRDDLARLTHQIAYRVTYEGNTLVSGTNSATLSAGIGVSPSGKLISSGDRALWLWLLRHGGPIGFMETSPDTDNGNMLHIRACGLDFDRSSPVRDDAWTVKGGTFAEPERCHGISAEAVCRCGLVGGTDENAVSWRDRHNVRPEGGGPLEVHAEVDSVINLLREML